MNSNDTNTMNEAQQTPAQCPLANDANGEPLMIPPEAVAWRVRKLARRAGRPKVIFDPETGRPLELALGVNIDDFATQVGESGRYRLEAIDAQGRCIPGCVAVTELILDEEPEAAQASNTPHADLRELVAQLVESNAQVMKALASAFGQVHPVLQQQAANNGGNQAIEQFGTMLVNLLAQKQAAKANGAT
jgi:hypothetical protein